MIVASLTRVSAAARSADGCMRGLDGCICIARRFARTWSLLAEGLRHYDEPGVPVVVLANGAPPVSLIEGHGGHAGVQDEPAFPAGQCL